MDIDKIILKSLNQEASLKEYEQLEIWKQESQSNLDFINSIMDKNTPQNTTYKNFDKDSAWSSVEKKMKKPRPSILTLAILFLVGAAIGYGLYSLIFGERAIDLYKTETAIENIHLADNSEIWLNTQSSLHIDSEFDNARKVALDGEAYFHVEADKTNPFVISLGNEEFIKVVGTSFNVVNDGEAFDLTVYSGVVELHAQGRVIELRKKDRVTRVNGSLTKYQDNNPNVTSWKNNELVFEDTSLEKVLEDVARHYKVNIKTADNLNFSNCSLRSRFKDQSIDEVMAELKNIFKLQYSKDAKVFTVTDLNCE